MQEQSRWYPWADYSLAPEGQTGNALWAITNGARGVGSRAIVFAEVRIDVHNEEVEGTVCLKAYEFPSVEIGKVTTWDRFRGFHTVEEKANKVRQGLFAKANREAERRNAKRSGSEEITRHLTFFGARRPPRVRV